tara:strand:- start:51 stop:395 length:345 start_codon:yes stop_codon:yes gene_type:complete
MRTVVAGSRTFNDILLMDEELGGVDFNITEVISGTAQGADTLGEKWAVKNDVSLKRIAPDWNKYGRSAGMIRNEEMAKCADALVAFWDGESRGTKHMIEMAKKYNLKIKIVSTT